MEAVPIPPSRRWPPRGAVADWVLASSMAVISTVEILVHGFGDSTPAVVALSVVLALTLRWRRRRPLPAVAAGMGGYSLLAVIDVTSNDLTSVSASLLILVYSVGMWERLRPAIAGLVIAVVTVGVFILTAGSGVADYPWAAILLGGTWGLGRAMRARLLEVSRLAEATARVRLEREHEAATAVAEERNRIARELHDIVSHGLSVMVVQAAAAEASVVDAPDEAVESLRSIQEVGRDAQASWCGCSASCVTTRARGLSARYRTSTTSGDLWNGSRRRDSPSSLRWTVTRSRYPEASA